MKEELLHCVWKYQFFNASALYTVNGKKVEVLKVGDYNSDAGPDFFNATLKIDNVIWVGNIEIHVESSAWNIHRHQEDKAYNNVILHLVYNDDTLVFNENALVIPTVVIKDNIDLDLLERYASFFSSTQKVLCANYLPLLSDAKCKTALIELLFERLAQKSKEIAQQIADKKYDLEWVLFSLLSAALGLKINKEPMLLLAQFLPYKVIRKHQNNGFQLESILFGQAGFLVDEFKEEYPIKLQREYQYLKQKYKLVAIEKHLWKFLRLRPASFPTIRIAQLRAILSQPYFYAKIKKAKTYDKLKKLLKVSTHHYWDTHYRFDKLSVKRKKKLGFATIDVIIINAIVPLYYHLGHTIPVYKTYAFRLLSKIKPEKNNIVKSFSFLGDTVKSAADTQAIIQLYNFYCSQKKCLTCSIGNQLMKGV